MAFSSVIGASSVIRPGVCTSATRPASPYDGQVIYETDTDLVKAYNGSSWVTIGPPVFASYGFHSVATSQTTNTTASYQDLTTVGPQVTITTGTSALAIISCTSSLPGGDNNWESAMSVAVSGATTISASDNWKLSVGPSNTAARAASRVIVFDGTLTAGSNTFTAKYKPTNSVTATFSNRTLVVLPL